MSRCPRAGSAMGMTEGMKRVCVFCGSSPGADPAYAAAATALGQAIAARGLGLVYGGGKIGLMGTVADAAIQAGAEVIGVIPEGLLRKELGHGALTELRVVKSMHERKAMMASLSDGFIVLPGGFGTLEEAVEILTWTQLGLQKAGLVFLDVQGFWSGLAGVFDQMVAQGFVRPHHRRLAPCAPTPEAALDLLAGFEPPAETVWIHKDET